MRMKKTKWLQRLTGGLLSGLMLVSCLTGCGATPNGSSAAADPPSGQAVSTEPVMGGEMVIAMDSEPKVLDPMLTTATLAWTLSWHMFEYLFTVDNNREIVPMLAEAISMSEDGLTYTITLRQGVTFHNGDTMDAADVVASLNRWGAVASSGKALFAKVSSVEDVDPYTVSVTLTEPDATFMAYIGAPNNGAIIIPAEIAQTAGDVPMTEYIGTGPYKFVEWKPNAHILLERFDGYSALDGEADGYGGKKVAYADTLKFVPVPDSTVQVAGVESGDFHYCYAASADDYDRLLETPGVKAVVSAPRAMLMFIMNTKEGPMTDLKTRQAFQAALDMAPISLISRGNADFWRMNPSLMQKESLWYTESGGEKYNQADAELAKALLAQSGYNGEAIRWITGYESYYNAALVAKEQLEAVGFRIDLQKYESGTESTMRQDPTQWDVSVTGYTNRPDPTQCSFLNSAVPGWWDNEEKTALLNEMLVNSDQARRQACLDRIQELFYEDVPYVKVCDYSTMRLMSDKLINFTDMDEIFFWNTWIAS